MCIHRRPVFELRFFFSEGVNGPEGGDLPLVLLKRKVKKLIEERMSGSRYGRSVGRQLHRLRESR